MREIRLGCGSGHERSNPKLVRLGGWRGGGMGYRFEVAPEVEQWASRLTAPLRSAWRGRPGSEARRMLGKIGFWIARPGLDAAYQRQLNASRVKPAVGREDWRRKA
jgi:hypothetical protein